MYLFAQDPRVKLAIPLWLYSFSVFTHRRVKWSGRVHELLFPFL